MPFCPKLPSSAKPPKKTISSRDFETSRKNGLISRWNPAEITSTAATFLSAFNMASKSLPACSLDICRKSYDMTRTSEHSNNVKLTTILCSIKRPFTISPIDTAPTICASGKDAEIVRCISINIRSLAVSMKIETITQDTRRMDRASCFTFSIQS